VTTQRKGGESMNVKKIPTKKISESVAEQLEEMILSGSLQAGEKLPSVRELCNLFDVGRTAVRDAITTLKGKGAVYVKQGEGTFICKFDSSNLFSKPVTVPNRNDLHKLFQVRKILEPGIAEMASLNRTEEDLKRMEFSLSQSLHEGWEGDYSFHMSIAKATGNEILIGLLELISTTTKKTMMEVHHYIQREKQAALTIFNQHEKIFQSIQSENANKAGQCMVEHLDYVEKLLQSQMAKEKTH
jgi:GntR family transcriptional regulator, transcriptional repressor for pyruvate dehydrogenase complex